MSKPVTLELTAEHALVLFDWLTRFNGQDREDFEDHAEERVLWDLEAMLEKALTEPFERDYERLLAAARAAVRGEDEGGRSE